jgi:hypothetical protein
MHIEIEVSDRMKIVLLNGFSSSDRFDDRSTVVNAAGKRSSTWRVV